MLLAFLFFAAFVVLLVVHFVRRFSGRETQSTRASDESPLEDDPLADDPKTSSWDRDVTMIASILFGVPVILAIGVVAIIVTAASGEGVGVFVLIFLGLCAFAYLKIRFL